MIKETLLGIYLAMPPKLGAYVSSHGGINEISYANLVEIARMIRRMPGHSYCTRCVKFSFFNNLTVIASCDESGASRHYWIHGRRAHKAYINRRLRELNALEELLG